MSTFDCAENLVCATLSGSNGIGVGLEAGTPNKIVVSASNIPNDALANSAININGTTIALGATGSLEIGDITDVNAGTNLVGGGTSGSLELSLTSSITGGLTDISGVTNISTTVLSASTVSASNYIGINANNINDFTTSVWNSVTGSSNITVINGTASLNDNISLSSVTASFSGSGANITNISTANISNFSSIVQSLVTGSNNITVTNGTASLNSTVAGLTSLSSTNISGTTVTGSFSGSGALINNITASGISNFSTDVRKQISGTGIINYDQNTGIISATEIGDITAVTAGTNLTGGGTSGSVTVSLTSSITSGLTNISNLTSLGAQFIELSRSAEIAFIEMGGPSGAHIDLKNPFSDDYDLRIKSYGTEGGGEIRNWDGASIILSGTNVGIGTTSPTERVTVASGASDRVGFDVQSVTSSIYFGSNTNGAARQLEFDRSTGLFKIKGRPAAGSFSDQLTIDIDGDVGIGTTTPNYKLEVNGTISGSAVYGLSGSSAQFPNFTNDVRAQFSAGTNITILNGAISASGGGSGTVLSGNAGYIAYYPSPGGTTVDDTTTIYTNGTNVGVGTTTLGSKLTVNGNISGSYLDLSTNIPSDESHTNKLFATDIPKAWGRINITDTSSIKVLDGSNIRAVGWDSSINALNLTLYFDLNNSGSFNSQINFLSTASFAHYTRGPPNLCLATMVSRSSNTICVKFWDIVNGSDFIPSNETGREVYLDFNYFQRL